MSVTKDHYAKDHDDGENYNDRRNDRSDFV